jgi:TolB-like protein/tetratricopeptide (TPR) repeat protein
LSSSLLVRLKQRKLVQWALAYLAGAWLLLQLLDILAQPFAWPDLALQATTVLLAIGFFAALVLAWYHGEKGAQRVTGIELLMLAGILTIAGAALAFVGRGGSPEPPPAESAASGVATVAEQGSIAVLPFVNMSSDSEQEYFSDGLTEELLNVLAQLPELRVASRTSAFAFKGKEVGIDSIGRALHVAHVLEGSVRKAGSTVRITAQLIDAVSGYHRWSASYDRDLRDVFAIQDEIARAIVSELRLTLSGRGPDAPLAREETTDPEAHVLVLRGIASARLGTPEGDIESIRLLREAVHRDPSYARARAELSASLFMGAYQGAVPHDEAAREARVEVERALALDSTLAEAHVSLALIVSWFDWDWQTAEGHFRRALHYNPNHAKAHSSLGWLLMRLGRPDDAIAEARRAVELDPLGAGARSNLGSMYAYARRAEAAVRAYEEALALSPESPAMLANIALTYSDLGRHSEALDAAGRARTLAPEDEFSLGVYGYVAAGADRPEEAEEVLRELDKVPGASPYLKATIHAALGRKDQAFALLQQAVEQRDEWAADLGVDPVFDRLRDDPRMGRLLQKAGLSY